MHCPANLICEISHHRVHCDVLTGLITLTLRLGNFRLVSCIHAQVCLYKLAQPSATESVRDGPQKTMKQIACAPLSPQLALRINRISAATFDRHYNRFVATSTARLVASFSSRLVHNMRVKLSLLPPFPASKLLVPVPPEVKTIKHLKRHLVKSLSTIASAAQHGRDLLLKVDGFELLSGSGVDMLEAGDVIS